MSKKRSLYLDVAYKRFLYWLLFQNLKLLLPFFSLLLRHCKQKAVGIGMACFGSKVIKSRRLNPHNLVDTNQMAREGNLAKPTGRQKGKNRRPSKEHHGADKDHSKENLSGRLHEKNGKAQKSSKLHNSSGPAKTVLRFV